MTQQIELISCTEDVLDRLLSASGESMQQWTADFDASSLEVFLPDEIYDADLDLDQLDAVRQAIKEVRLHVLISIFAIIFRNGHHPKRVVRNVYKLAKLYCPESVKHLNNSELALLSSDTITASSMRSIACNKFIEEMSPQDLQSYIAHQGTDSLRRLAALQWNHRTTKAKSKTKKTGKKTKKPTSKKTVGKQQELPLNL